MNKIKKIWPQLVIGVIVILFIGAAYYNKEFKEEKAEEQVEMSKAAIDEELGYTPEDYIVLGKYKGLEYDQSKAGVSDKELQDAINDELLDYKEVKREVKERDCVNIDYTAYIDGKEEENLSETEFDIVIGDQDLGEEFEKAVLGKKAGDKVSVTVKDASYFPTEEGKDYSGTEVEFEIKINSVSEEFYHELTEEWVKDNYDYYECDSVKEFRKMMKDSLLEDSKETIKEDTQTDLWQMVMDNSQMNEYPQELYDEIVAVDDADIAYWADYWGMTVEEYYEFNDMDEDDITKMYIDDVKAELIMWAIAKAEGISVTDEEVQDGFADMYEEYGFENVAEMKEQYSDYEIEHALVEQKVIELIVDNAIIKEVPSVEEKE